MNRSHVLTRSKSVLAKGFRVALIASPVLFSVAPSHATTLTRTFSGFTEAFEPLSANWTKTVTTTGTATFSPTTLALFRTGTQGGSPQVSYLLDPTVFETLYKPAGAPGAVKFLGGNLSYDWSWVSTSTSSAAANYNFRPTTDGINGNEFSPASGTTANGSYPSTALAPYSTFGFIHTRTNTNVSGGATGTISNFQFIAQYETVPGPLPLAGAAAAFAWSRRLRRRLKTAQASV